MISYQRIEALRVMIGRNPWTDVDVVMAKMLSSELLDSFLQIVYSLRECATSLNAANAVIEYEKCGNPTKDAEAEAVVNRATALIEGLYKDCK